MAKAAIETFSTNVQNRQFYRTLLIWKSIYAGSTLHWRLNKLPISKKMKTSAKIKLSQLNEFYPGRNYSNCCILNRLGNSKGAWPSVEKRWKSIATTYYREKKHI